MAGGGILNKEEEVVEAQLTIKDKGKEVVEKEVLEEEVVEEEVVAKEVVKELLKALDADKENLEEDMEELLKFMQEAGVMVKNP